MGLRQRLNPALTTLPNRLAALRRLTTELERRVHEYGDREADLRRYIEE